MELKPYQQQVIEDLARFLDYVQSCKNSAEAFEQFWLEHPRTPLRPEPNKAIEPYKNNVPRVPHVCIKVPTAGGKTFIACNALRPIFNAFSLDKPRAVIWLVPSVTILEQTLKSLRDPNHPYRQKINAHFGHRVEVFDKAALLQGSGFNASTVREQLSIMVFSFDSLKARNKEDRKVFQENGNLHSFAPFLEPGSDLSLGEVIRYLNPVLVVDESHNAESPLSVDMLKALNPCFILDLTATPRKNSNILSFVDALALSREKMVKLPVIVYNHTDKTEVINSALQLRQRLEAEAKQAERQGGPYIRPIVLFQAQPKLGGTYANEAEEKSNVQKLKDKLIQLGIPEAEIKIKTANLNEISGLDLMSRDCPVRYIITINALKEGWDCPFAYILASLADRNSAVDVEQILGRVLRQPYVRAHSQPLLNMSYVLTASVKFMATLDNIVKGLNRAGFSEQDYKLAEPDNLTEPDSAAAHNPLHFGSAQTEVDTTTEDEAWSDIDENRLSALLAEEPLTVLSEPLAQIEQAALQQQTALDQTIAQQNQSGRPIVPSEISQQVKTYPIKQVFEQEAGQLRLPQFFLNTSAIALFNIGAGELLLEKDNLLEGFALSKCDTHINFQDVDLQLYKVDLDETKRGHTPTYLKLETGVKEYLMAYMLDPDKKDRRIAGFETRIMGLIGNMYPIADREIRLYVRRVLEGFSEGHFNDFIQNEYSYTDKIKQKIRSLSEDYAARQFRQYLDTDRVFIKPHYAFPDSISPSATNSSLPKSLYEREAKMNDFEFKVINEVANMSNILFWTRNIERRGFRINGFVNHYPDFIIQTKKGKTIILETKGDHLDAQAKIDLGALWAAKAGNEFRYFMVYEWRQVPGAYTLEQFLDIVKAL